MILEASIFVVTINYISARHHELQVALPAIDGAPIIKIIYRHWYFTSRQIASPVGNEVKSFITDIIKFTYLYQNGVRAYILIQQKIYSLKNGFHFIIIIDKASSASKRFAPDEAAQCLINECLSSAYRATSAIKTVIYRNLSPLWICVDTGGRAFASKSSPQSPFQKIRRTIDSMASVNALLPRVAADSPRRAMKM